MVAHATDASDSSGTPPLVRVVCPLLELASAVAGGGSAVEPSNRCRSFSPPRDIAVTQQRLVCLGDAYADCPLFAKSGRRGSGPGGRSARAMPAPMTDAADAAAVAALPAGSGAAGLAMPGDVPSFESRSASVLGSFGAATRALRGRQARPASRPMPTIVAAIILVIALGAAFLFTTSRGGLSMPGGGSSAPGTAAGSGVPGASTANPTVEPVPASPAPSVSASAAAAPTLTPAPSTVRSPTPGPTARPSAAPTTGPAQTPSPSPPPAFAGLDACPDRVGCYLYRIRSGDNLTLVALRFGITLTALRAANPGIVDPSLIHVGDLIRVPVPAPTP